MPIPSITNVFDEIIYGGKNFLDVYKFENISLQIFS